MLRRERESAGLTQSQIAAIVGLQRTSITQIELGSQQAPLHVIYDLCSALKIDIFTLLPSNEEVAELSAVPVAGTERISVMVNEKPVNAPPKTAELLQQMEKLLREQTGEGNREENHASRHRKSRARSANHSQNR